MKIECAVYEYIDGVIAGYRIIRDVNICNDTSLVRVSEIVTVDFPERATEEILPEMLAGIDKEIQEIEAEAILKVNTLKGKRSELLCLNVL